MKKKFFKLFFTLTLMLGFTFSLASCKKDTNPVEPTPEPTPTPDPTPTPEPTPDPEPVGPVTLTELPDGYYSKLFQLPDSILVTFKDCSLDGSLMNLDGVLTITDDSYLRIGIVDDTLKANGYIKITGSEPLFEHFIEGSFSLDDSFIARGFVSNNLDLSTIDKVKPRTDEDDATDEYEDDEAFIYKEIELSKDKLFALINNELEKNDIDFDITKVDTLDEIKSLIKISDETIGGAKALIETLVSQMFGLVFEESFGPDEVKLEFTLKNLNLINTLVSSLTVENVVDLLLGNGAFNKIISKLEDYSLVNTLNATPKEGVQYFTLVDGEYVPCKNLTEFDPNTEYYIDNKDLGSYTLADLLITSEEDKEGFVSVDAISNGVNTLLDLVKYIPTILSMTGKDISEINIPFDSINEEMIINVIKNMFMLKDEAGFYEAKTGLTEWEGYSKGMFGKKYYTQLFVEADTQEGFAEEYNYYTLNDKNEYVLVDTKTVETPQESVTYYVVAPVEVEIEVVLKTPDANVEYYTLNDDNEYVLCENLTQFDKNKNYFVKSETSKTGYELFDIYTYALPDSTATYYTGISSLAKFLSTDTLQNMTVKQLLGKGYMLYAMLSTPDEVNMKYITEGIDIDKIIAPYVEMAKQLKGAKVYDLIAPFVDRMLPNFVEISVTEWDTKKTYFTYNEETKQYDIVDTTVVTAPQANVKYYEIVERDAAALTKLISDGIKFVDDGLTFNIVTDNDAKLKNILFALDFDKVKGEINVDFTQEYKDEIREDLLKNIPYANRLDDNSTQYFEELLNDNVFNGYVGDGGETYSLVKENDKYVGFKTTLGSTVTEYSFGTNKEKGDKYSSEINYYGSHYLSIYVRCYNKTDKKFTYNLLFIYDVEAKKFVSPSLLIIDEYYYDYAKKDFVSIMVEVDTEEVKTPEEDTSYYVFNEATNAYDLATVTTFEENVKYYTKKNAEVDATHPFIVKSVSRLTGSISYEVRFFVSAE